MNFPVPGRSVVCDPVLSEQIVAHFCERAGMEIQRFWDPEQVVLLLQRCGYAVELGVLNEFLRKRYVSPPPKNEWTPVFVHALAAALECRRRWLPFPNEIHDVKKTGIRLQLEQAIAAGVTESVNDVADHTLEDLLLQLVGEETRAGREVIYECVKLRLEYCGFHEELPSANSIINECAGM